MSTDEFFKEVKQLPEDQQQEYFQEAYEAVETQFEIDKRQLEIRDNGLVTGFETTEIEAETGGAWDSVHYAVQLWGNWKKSGGPDDHIEMMESYRETVENWEPGVEIRLENGQSREIGSKDRGNPVEQLVNQVYMPVLENYLE